MRDTAAILEATGEDLVPPKENYSSKVRDNLGLDAYCKEGPIQIGLRLYPTQLEALDAYCKEKGLDRTSAVRVAINQMLDGSGPSAAPVATSGGSGVDQPARDALVALKDRIDELEIRLENKVANAIGTAKAAHEIATDAHMAQKEATDKKAATFDKWSQRLKEADQRNVQVDNFNETFLKS